MAKLGTMVGVMSNERQSEHGGIPLRDPVAVIADYLGQFGADIPDAYDRPDPQTLVRWLHDEGWNITPVQS
jgi:hypothetical protein